MGSKTFQIEDFILDNIGRERDGGVSLSNAAGDHGKGAVRRRAKAYKSSGQAAKPFGRGGRTNAARPRPARFEAITLRRSGAGLREFRPRSVIPCAPRLCGKAQGSSFLTSRRLARGDDLFQTGKNLLGGISGSSGSKN